MKSKFGPFECRDISGRLDGFRTDGEFTGGPSLDGELSFDAPGWVQQFEVLECQRLGHPWQSFLSNSGMRYGQVREPCHQVSIENELSPGMEEAG